MEGAHEVREIAEADRICDVSDRGRIVDEQVRRATAKTQHRPPVIGIAGTGGAGKSSLNDELLNRFVRHFPDRQIAVVAMDPTRRRSGGALLGDRIRMNSLSCERIFMRSLATRRQHLATSAVLADTLMLLKFAGFDLIIVETAGIGQSDTEIIDLADLSLYVMTSDYGAASQAGFSVGGRVMQAIFLPAMAIAFAAGPIAGQNFGAGRFDRVRETLAKALLLNSIVMITVTLLLQWHPDVLIADLGMPVMNGFDLIRRVRESTDPVVRRIPAAALTAYARSEDRAKVLRSGFEMHLSKPIDPAELLAAVAALARRSAGA